MRNYKKYRSTVVELFQSFLAEKIEKRELIFALTEIDKEMRKNPKTLKGLWFKFFKGDTEAFQAYKIAKENHIKEVANKWKNKITENVYHAMLNYKVDITD